MKIKVDVDTKTFIRFVLVLAGFAAATLLIWRAWAALMIIGVAAFLALALNSPVSAISRRLPGHSRVLGAAVSYVVVLAIVGVFVYIAVPPIITQTSRVIEALPQYVQDLGEKRGAVADLINRYNLQDELNQLVAGAQQQVSGLAQGIGSSVVNGVSSILTGVITLITILVLTFLMLIEGPRWIDRTWALYTDKHKLERHKRLAVKMYNVVTGFVNGQVLVATVAAAVTLTVLLVLHYFFPALPVGAIIPLTGVVFIFELIPIIGSSIAATIISIVLVLNDFGAMISYLIFFLIYVQIESNFIAPLVQSRKVALSALSVFIAIVLGITLMGIVGGIVAIPIAGCIRVLLLDYMEHRPHKPVPKKPGLLAKLAAKVTAD